MDTWTKAIPEKRDKWQSGVLVWLVGALIVIECLPFIFFSIVKPHSRSAHLALWAGLVSLTFGIVVWALRAATPLAAFLGAIACFQITVSTGWTTRPVYQSGLAPLVSLFVLIYVAGKVGRSHTKARSGGHPTVLAMTDDREERRGRSTSQVIANLGAAGLAAIMSFDLYSPANKLFVLGALAEATADTVSSEIGAAFGGRPFLVTTFRRVEPGTDGAVSLLGTLAGCGCAGLVAAVGVWSMGLTMWEGLAALTGGVVGLLFDSLLGATVERRGWIGNDWVNFLSTLVGGLIAWGTAAALSTPGTA